MIEALELLFQGSMPEFIIDLKTGAGTGAGTHAGTDTIVEFAE
jgi:hypothetical protein